MDFDNILESDDDTVSAADLLKIIEESWINEKFSPEILPHKIEFVDCMYLQIEEMSKNVSTLDRNTDMRRLHELELNRIKYVLSSYLRARLLKIETYSQTILSEEEARINAGEEPYLTPAEKQFATSFKAVLDRYNEDIFRSISAHVPDESKQHPILPNLHSFVFFQSKKAIEGVIIDEQNQDIIDIGNNSKMILPYSSISNLLKNDNVKLI